MITFPTGDSTKCLVYPSVLSREQIKGSPIKKYLGMLLDEELNNLPCNDLITYTCSPESQTYSGLHQRHSGQQGKGADSASLLSHETPPAVLHPPLGSSAQEGQRPVGV